MRDTPLRRQTFRSVFGARDDDRVLAVCNLLEGVRILSRRARICLLSCDSDWRNSSLISR